MKRSIGVLFFVICVIAAQAQDENKQFIRKGLIRSMATISVGQITKISIHGNLEYYMADNVSVRGDSYYSLKTFNPYDQEIVNGFGYPPYLTYNHQTFAGAFYHFKTKNNFDPYFGLQPGVALSQSANAGASFAEKDRVYSSQTVNPLISPSVGFNLYFERWFHLFADARYVFGKHLSDFSEPASLNELKFSFGLGFNLNLLKKK